MAVEVDTHEDSGTAHRMRTLLAQVGNLARGLLHAVVLEHSEFHLKQSILILSHAKRIDLLAFVLVLLGLSVSLFERKLSQRRRDARRDLLLTLLSSGNQRGVEVESGVLIDLLQQLLILPLTTGENETLILSRDRGFFEDCILQIRNGGVGIRLQAQSAPRERPNKNHFAQLSAKGREKS